ncbi:MAG TPA: ABC transporter substrate-binding protein [Chloroflexota bacterium]|nr:ABC transporter substrate-binding protein [Chloroflexota bacterium]
MRTMALGMVLLTLVACGPAAAPAPAAPPRGAAPAPAAPPVASSPAAAAPSAEPSAALQAIVEGARQEGQLQLMWSAHSFGGPDGVARLAAAFNRLYGLNLNVQFTVGPSMPEMASKVAQEVAAGRPASVDVALGAVANMASLVRADALQPVDWLAWAPNVQDPRLLAPDGVAVQIASRMPGITYNTNRVRPDEVPATMQDLLKPQYKGRIASTPYGANFDLLASPELWGEQRVTDYVGRLADQVSGLIPCGAVERVIAGEFDFFALDCGSYEAHAWQQKGAPVGHVIPSDAAMINYLYMGVPRNAVHPNAAKLWINFMLTREAQDMEYEAETVDHHLLPGSKTAGEVTALQAKGVQFAEIDVQFIQRQDDQEVSRVRQTLLRELQR